MKFKLGETVKTYSSEGTIVEIEEEYHKTVYYVDVNGDRQRHKEQHLRGLTEEKPWKVAGIRVVMGKPGGNGMEEFFDDLVQAEESIMWWMKRLKRWGGVIYIDNDLYIGIWKDGDDKIIKEKCYPPFSLTKNDDR